MFEHAADGFCVPVQTKDPGCGALRLPAEPILLRLEVGGECRAVPCGHDNQVALARWFRRLPVLDELCPRRVVTERRAAGADDVDRILVGLRAHKGRDLEGPYR